MTPFENCSRIECGDPRSKAALHLAMFNLEKQFAVVGVMEEFETSISMMEAMLPRFGWTRKKEKLLICTNMIFIVEKWHSYCCFLVVFNCCDSLNILCQIVQC